MMTAWTGAQDFKFIAVAPHVYKGSKSYLMAKKSLPLQSVADIAVVIRLRLSETRKSGENAD